MYSPPRSHQPKGEDRYVTVYSPKLETLDELGIIEVIDWGGNP